jgi:hypothetical protein
MFNKNNKPNEIRPAVQTPKEKKGVIKNKNAKMPDRNKSENTNTKSDTHSEGGRT